MPSFELRGGLWIMLAAAFGVHRAYFSFKAFAQNRALSILRADASAALLTRPCYRKWRRPQGTASARKSTATRARRRSASSWRVRRSARRAECRPLAPMSASPRVDARSHLSRPCSRSLPRQQGTQPNFDRFGSFGSPSCTPGAHT